MTTTPTQVPDMSEAPDITTLVTAFGPAVAFVIVMLAIAYMCTFCRCNCCDEKRKSKPPAPPAKDYDLDTKISVTGTISKDAVNTEAVEKIHTSKGFNLKKMIGRVLMRQVEGLMLDPSRLDIGEPLGEGNFGVVYRATLASSNRPHPRPVAVKCINGSAITSEDMTAFIEEVLRMRHFNHEHVLSLIGLAIEKGLPEVVMPFMSNGDLRRYVSDPAHDFLARQLVEFGRQVASGMAYLSKQGFIHRDLAARNCMVSDENVVKVADFGLSRDIFNADYYKADRKTPLPVRWMAVESLKSGRFSVKSDVWSFGVLLWELFTRGSQPYPGLDNATVVAYVKKGERMKKPEYTPEDIYSLMMECWHVDSDKRPTFSEVTDSLQRLIAGSRSSPDSHPDYENQTFKNGKACSR